jgi:PKD repeat protein
MPLKHLSAKLFPSQKKGPPFMRSMLRPGSAVCLMMVAGMLSAAEIEPNDIATQASTLTLGVADNGAHDATDSTDWWKVTTTADGKLTLRVSDPTTDECVGLQLFEQNETTLLKNNGSCGISNYVSEISYNNLAPATYYIMATRGRTPGGAYTLTATFTPESPAVDAEPNNTRDNAGTLTMNGSVTGHLGFYNGAVTRDSIAWDNDKRDNIDWWKVTTAADGRLRISVKSTASLCVQLRIRTSVDTVGSLDNNGQCGISNYRDYVEVKNLAPGTYYVEAWDANWKYNTNYGSYTLSCSLYTETTPNDTGSNDYASQAKPLAVNDSIKGHLGYYYGDVADTIAWINGKRDNVDWWKVITKSDGRLIVRVKSSATLCVQLKLHTKADSIGTIDANGQCGISNYRDFVQVNNLAPGTYYVEAFDPSWKSNTFYGGYTLACSLYTVTAVNDSEPNDYAGQAQRLTLNDSTTGHLGYYYGDVADTIAWINGKRDNIDWWKIVIPQRGKLSATVSSDPTLCVQMGLRSPADTVNDLKGNGNCGISNYNPTLDYFVTPGSYFIAAYDPSWNYNTKYGAYQLKTVYTLAPAAAFDAIGEGTVYTFVNFTAGATSYSWNFGDNAASQLKNPAHTYANPGVFTVTLIASNSAGADTVTRSLTLKGLHKVEADRAGNTGDATVYIYGGGFKAASSVYLVKSGQTDIAASPVGLPRPGMLRAQFDLRGAPTGVYTVRVTTPGDSAMNLTSAFTVETGRVAEPGVAVVGRDRILFNRWQTYTISYWNSSNIDAHGVPLWIAMSDLPDSQVQIVDFKVVLPKTAVDSGFSRIEDSMPLFYRTDSLFGTPFNSRIYPLYIPVIPAGQTENIHIRVKTAGDIQLYAWMNTPYYQSPLKGNVADCIWWAQAKAFRDGVIDILPIPGLGCVSSIATKVYDPFDYPCPSRRPTRVG